MPRAKPIFAEDIREAVMTDGMKIWVGKYEWGQAGQQTPLTSPHLTSLGWCVGLRIINKPLATHQERMNNKPCYDGIRNKAQS